MTPFFRNIRKDLADDNRPIKYLRYAFGEIILVVIGILIALQINNWNTIRKNKEREAVFVNQLAADLQNSTKDLNKVMTFFSDRAIASGKVVHAFYKPSMQKNFNPMVFSIPWSNQRYMPVMGTAKALVNSGNIDLIKSLKLRTSIISYLEKVEALLADIDRYEESYYRRGINEIDQQTELSALTAEYLKENDYTWPKTISDFERAVDPLPEDMEVIPFPVTVKALFKNQRIFHAYSNLLLAHRNTYYQYKAMLQATEELLQLIQSEGYAVKIKDLSENKALVFDSTDLKIVQEANRILSDETKWNKDDDRTCFDDIHNDKYSLFCALYKASVDVAGEYKHRRAVMQQVRFIIDERNQGRVINHRLMDWNNHPETSFEEVKQVLKETEGIIETQLKNNK